MWLPAFGPPIAVHDVVRATAAPYRVGRGLLGLVALAAMLQAVLALAGASCRAAWRGLGVGLAIGTLALWGGSGLVAGRSPVWPSHRWRWAWDW